MTLLTAPLWIQLVLVAEALALAWLAGRFGRMGFSVGVIAAAASWFLLALAASFLVGRLEGGGAAAPSGVLQGALSGAMRLGAIAWPLLLAGAAAGAVVRWAFTRRRPRGQGASGGA
ncbi:hypothetical protein [Phenylobacterium sp.]|uniref:hypothetical protein n=1 Tax=Phenylobacterium sp. TaxID=1871053 RepID=UPI002D036AE0|nr:hypothetical protein [Phenylobacterium sp.]HVI30826.1 hypothetical protein [Phenylobacterium sp.]